jgi:hypothetical protein
MAQIFHKHEDLLQRGLTTELWKNFPKEEILVHKDANVGSGVMMEPCSPPFAGNSSTNTMAGNGVRAFTDAGTTIGGLTKAQYTGGVGFRMGGTTDNQACELQWGGGGEQFVISDTAAEVRELVFECAFRLSTVTTNELGFFIGLASAQTLDGDFIADNGADVADLDMVGLFHTHADTTGMDVIYQKAGSGFVVHEADWGPTLAINTWYIFGMRYVPGVNKVDLYWGTGDRSTTAFAKDDNPILSTDIDDATFPDGDGLCPTIAVKFGGTAETMDIRTLACAQMGFAAD